jgi:HEAT repeat protein
LHAKGKPGLYAVQDLVEKAQDDAEHARALRALGELGDPEAEWELHLQLKQTSPHVLAAVITAATQLHLDKLTKGVAEKVGNPDPELCAALGAAVATFPDVAEQARQALDDAEGDRQLSGLRILTAANIPVDQAQARKLITSPSPEVRFFAGSALAPSDPETATSVLAQFLDGPQAQAAIVALGKIGCPSALNALLSLIGKEQQTPALNALATSDAGVRVLLKKRSITLVQEQVQAIDAALNAQPTTPDLLVALLGDENGSLAKQAAELLGQQPAGVAALARCLDALAPQTPLCASGLAGSPLAGDQVKLELRSLDARVRAAMATGLGVQGPIPERELLAPLARDRSPAVRAAVTLPLGRLQSDGVPLLTILVRDSEPSVRTAAAAQLIRKVSGAALHLLVAEAVGDAAIRPDLLEVAEQLPGRDALRLLLASAGSDNRQERRTALALLARRHEPEAVHALMDRAAQDSDPELREYALTLLANE